MLLFWISGVIKSIESWNLILISCGFGDAKCS